MVLPTRRKRKQISYYEPDSDDDDDDDVIEEINLSMKAKQSGALCQAQQNKKKAKSPTKPRFEIIPDELLPHILSYLDNVREIYHLSNMKKSFRKALSPELVVRAAVFSGRPYAHILDGLMREISNQRIRVPSTLRLLRLLNAKSCERGKECFCFNLESNRSGPLMQDNYRSFGMAICAPCLHALSSNWGNDCPSTLRSDKICTHGWSTVLCSPQVEQVTKEAVGPMIFFRDIKQIQYSYNNNSKREEVLEATIASAKAQAIGQEDKVRLQRFSDAHKKAKSEYYEYLEAKNRIQFERRERIVAKRVARKQELTGVVFRKLEPHFAGFQYESLILNRDWRSNYTSGTYEFHHWPSTVALDRLMQAPSSATQKKINEAAVKVKRIYTRLEECGFLGGSFPNDLRQWLNAHGNIPIHEQALVRYFADKKNSMSILPKKNGGYYSTHRLYQATLDGHRAKMILLVLSAEECRDAFALEVSRAADRSRSQQKRYQLAKHVWTIQNSWRRGDTRGLLHLTELGEFGQNFHSAKDEYTRVLRKILRYKKHPDTKAWIEDTLESGGFSESLTPRDAIDTLYEGDFGRSGTDASFAEWRRHHATLVMTAFISERGL